MVIPQFKETPKPRAIIESTSEEAEGTSDTEHPFADAPDAAYAAPANRNFGAPPKAPPAKKPTPAYRTIAPVYDDKVAEVAFDKAMSSLVTITQRELLSLSPEVRALLREAVSARRTSTKEPAQPSNQPAEIHVLASEEEIAYAIDDLGIKDLRHEADKKPMEIFAQAAQGSLPLPPPNATIIPDIYDTYLQSLPEGQVPGQLIVAKESMALRSIFPVVNNHNHVEAILDPGSQIIAMSEEVCIDLALPYDPGVILTMQSANGAIDQSLGLARNVPIYIGDITLYVQIHIIRSPAYDILLGRPFDTLTESVVRNYANEEQTITIFDPNTGRRATVPTSPRGRARRIVQRENFTASRI